MQLNFGPLRFFTSIVVAIATWKLQKRNARPLGEHIEDIEAIIDLISCSGNEEWQLNFEM
jgi:hypothetical protein